MDSAINVMLCSDCNNSYGYDINYIDDYNKTILLYFLNR